GERLLQVDDVDAASLGEDEALHLGVPAAGLVPEVDAPVEQLANCYYGHGRAPSAHPRNQAGVLISVVLRYRLARTWCPARTTHAQECGTEGCDGVLQTRRARVVTAYRRNAPKIIPPVRR